MSTKSLEEVFSLYLYRRFLYDHSSKIPPRFLIVFEIDVLCAKEIERIEKRAAPSL